MTIESTITMTLQSPIEIGARLLPTVRVGDGADLSFISIEYSKRPGSERRVRYQYHIDGPGWSHSDDDLQSGNPVQGRSRGLQAGLESLLAFLTAAAESYRYRVRTNWLILGRNEGGFPGRVVMWAYEHEDELACLQIQLQEIPNLILE